MNDDLPSEVIGLDIGGTKTHGVRWRADEVVAEAKTGSANLQNVSVATASANLSEVFNRLGTAGVQQIIAGSGGVDTSQDAEQLDNLITPHAPRARVRIIHDTELILAAGGASRGIAVIAGTGSVAWGIDSEGRQARSGGWGHLLGDEGSGYWIGREAVRCTLRQHDNQRPLTELGKGVLAENGLQYPEELVALFHRNTERHYWADQARLVFEASASGDGSAEQIIDAACQHICTLVRDVASVLNVFSPVVIGGGMAVHQPALQQKIRDNLQDPQFDDVRFLDCDPVMGVQHLLHTPA